MTSAEDEHDGDVEVAGGEALRTRLQTIARDRRLLIPRGLRNRGALGLSMCQRAPIFEAAGRSLFAPMALNVNAPDEGKVHLIDQVATLKQRETFLAPLVRGNVADSRSSADPAQVRTLASLRQGAG